MLLAVRSTSSAAASENATRELVGSAMSNPSELVHGRDMAPPYSCCYWPHGQGAPEGKAPQTAGSLPWGRGAIIRKCHKGAGQALHIVPESVLRLYRSARFRLVEGADPGPIGPTVGLVRCDKLI